MESSSITKAISATKTKTSHWVLDTRSSKSLISAVGPPTLTCAEPVAASGRWLRNQVMVLRAPRSSGSTDSTADSMALLLLSANTTGATEVILGDWLICLLISAIVWACAAEDASPSGKVTSTCTGPSAPGPSASDAADTPARISCEELNWRSRLLPNTIDSAGTAIASSTADAVSADAHGRRITPPIQCVQNRDCVVSGCRDKCSAADRLGRPAERRQHRRRYRRRRQ